MDSAARHFQQLHARLLSEDRRTHETTGAGRDQSASPRDEDRRRQQQWELERMRQDD
jgi:hypothetical protein